jgi:hypothetical protein
MKMNAVMWARAVVLKLSARRGAIPDHVTEADLREYIETGKMNWTPIILPGTQLSFGF